MVTRNGTQSCILTDVSSTGLKVATSDPLKVGSEAILTWGPYEAFGDVIWTTPTHCGIALVDPLSNSVVIGTRQLDEAERLPEDNDLVRRSAFSFVKGEGRR